MIKVAAYCRVSTDKDDQINSFESQKCYFEKYINLNPDWEMIEVYADEGLTGTSTKKRKAFNKMIADAHLGKFDLILTKEVSRFARNTVDTLQYTRELKSLNIGVNFLLDNIFTLDPDAELRLTIMASLAQEESRKTSERVKWGQKRQMEKGVVFGRNMLGYDVINGTMHINTEGAEIVKLIFHKYVFEKKGCYTIARELREAGYRTITGNAIWSNTVILKVLRNEKYCGDLTQKKTYTPDYLTHSKKYNHGEEEFVKIINHHEAIIEREIWNMAQEELSKRKPNDKMKLKHSNRYPLSGKIFCGKCGGHFVSRTKKRKDGSQYKAWRCFNAAQHGNEKVDACGNKIGCNVSAQIRDEDFMLIIQKVIESLELNCEAILKEIFDVLKTVFSDKDNNYIDKSEIIKKKENLKLKIKRLLDLYLSNDLSKDDYRAKKSEYEAEIAKLETLLLSAEKASCSYDADLAIKDMCDHMRCILEGTVRDEIFYKNIVEKVVVYSREKLDVYLNLLPHKWSVVLNSVLEQSTLCGSISDTTYQYRSASLLKHHPAWYIAGKDNGEMHPIRRLVRRIV